MKSSQGSLQVVLPGERIVDLQEQQQDAEENGEAMSVCLGPGLIQTGDHVQAINAGLLRHIPKENKWWVQSNRWRYVPATGEPVIGIVAAKHAEGYRIDLGSAHQAVLPLLAFEGATKRNKPNLAVGAVVYARVSLANKDMEPEIECFNSNTGKSEGFGELEGGFTVRCSLAFCHRLLTSTTPILAALGEYIAFEVAVGLNGLVWVNAGKDSPQKTVLIANAIRNSEHLNRNECYQMVRELVSRL